MTTPDIADLCKRLRRAGLKSSVEAADALERQAAENKRLREALKRARRYVADLPFVGDADLAIIDAALTGKEI